MVISTTSKERGSVLITLFILVALFGLLSFAFLQNTGNNVGWVKKEADKTISTTYQDCTNSVNMAVRRLETRGCGTQISLAADGSNASPGAPADGSCSVFHVKGGGVKTCHDPSRSEICTTTAQIGEVCAGLVYFGTLGGNRLFTTITEDGAARWATTGNISIVGASSNSDGLYNTNVMVASNDAGSPYPAAILCRSKGPEWYLPSDQEGQLLWQNRNTGALAGTYGTSFHWTSTEQGMQYGHCVNSVGGIIVTSKGNTSRIVRCVRRF